MAEMIFEWKCIVTDPPKNGRFVAVYSDMSGASLFKASRRKIMNADGETGDLFERGYLWWIPLPSGVKLWFEND